VRHSTQIGSRVRTVSRKLRWPRVAYGLPLGRLPRSASLAHPGHLPPFWWRVGHPGVEQARSGMVPRLCALPERSVLRVGGASGGRFGLAGPEVCRCGIQPCQQFPAGVERAFGLPVDVAALFQCAPSGGLDLRHTERHRMDGRWPHHSPRHAETEPVLRHWFRCAQCSTLRTVARSVSPGFAFRPIARLAQFPLPVLRQHVRMLLAPDQLLLHRRLIV